MTPEPRDGSILLGLSVALLLGLGFLTWAVGSTTTPAETADLHDSLGRGASGLRWAAGPMPTGSQPPPAAPTPLPARPRGEALLAGRACLPMSYLLANRERAAEYGFSRDVACSEK